MQSPLAAAFDYPVRSDSLARKKHAQNPSASSIASSSSSSNAGGLGRGRGREHAQTRAHGYSSSSAHTRSSSIATDLTTASSSYGADYGSPSGSKSRPFMLDDDDDVETRDAHGQVGEGDEDEQLPRTDSTLLLRERTRYRSSASYAPPLATTYPLQGAFGSLSISSSAAVSQEEYEADDARLGSSENAHLELLAALAATSTTLDTCFCGSAPEEDSIYCSRACAQADALNALCGGGGGGGSGSASSGGDEDGAGSSDAASLRSYQSSSNASCLSSGAESSHYRRVEKEETRRATEKERALRRLKSSHRKPVPKQHGFETKTSSNASPSASRPTSSSRALPALRTASSSSRPRSPATASSQRSSSSCLPPSPLRDSTPSPCIVEPDSAPSREEDAPQGLGFEQFRPCTPSPRTGASSQNKDGSMLVSDIYASYLTATPRDGHQNLLQTPTSHHLGASSAPQTFDHLATTPRAMYLAQGGQAVHRDDDEEDEESPTQHCGTSNVGLRMLELCDSDDEDASDRRGRGKTEREDKGQTWYHQQQHYDEARDSLSESGWAGGHRMQQRMAERTSSSSRATDRSCSPASSSAAAGRMYGHMRGKLSFDDVVGILGA